MELDIYQRNLAGLLLLCGTLLAVRNPIVPAKSQPSAQDKTRRGQNGAAHQGSQWAFYVVYSLVMGADWLQGPFLYSLYRDEHRLSPSLVSTLFSTGFAPGALSGYFIGSIADRFGRRAACLFFCIAYAASCLLTMSPTVPLLFAGRVLGGISTSLLFSVFESWMVTDFHNRFLERKGLDLSRTFGTMSTLNSIAAIASGVASEWLVSVTGTRKAPFAASMALLGLAWLFIYGQWDENYGEAGGAKRTNQPAQRTLFEALANKRVLSLGLASTMFEGSMYLFVFFWGPALRSAQKTPSDLPYGIIFASFMASMMASSLVFNLVMARPPVSHGGLLIGIMAVSNLCFFALSTPKTEQTTFWLFCVFEACVGLYWPCMGYLKGKVVEDGVRAQVYGILRIPLNVFVVASLLLTGDGSEYGRVFSACSAFLLASCSALMLTMLGTGGP